MKKEKNKRKTHTIRQIAFAKKKQKQNETQPLNRRNLTEIGKLMCPCANFFVFAPVLSASIQMVCFLFRVYVHISNKHNEREKERKNIYLQICAQKHSWTFQ